jgi:hypothetical protein
MNDTMGQKILVFITSILSISKAPKKKKKIK